MEQDALIRAARREFDAKLTLRSSSAVFHGAAIPLPGDTTVEVGTAGIDATIVDESGWQHRAWQTFPPGTMRDPAMVFRPTAPNQLIHKKHYGRIETSDGWSADDVIYLAHGSHIAPSIHRDTYTFRVQKLRKDGPAAGNPVVGLRAIYRRAGFNVADKIEEGVVATTCLVGDEDDPEKEFIAVAYDFVPDELTEDAVWHTVNLLAGNTTQRLATEHLDENGDIVYTEHRVGHASRDARQRFFHRIFPDYGTLSAGGFGVLVTGIRHLLRKNFPIDVVLQHLHLAAGEPPDIEAQHLALAIHTAIEAWARFSEREHWIPKAEWRKIGDALRKYLKKSSDYGPLSDEVKDNLRTGISTAGRTSTAWRQQFLFDSLGIDVSGEDDARALGYRNELLHNGYFLKRWHELSFEEQQQRFNDVDRLKRLTLLIIFRLVGYSGDFSNPVTMFAETVNAEGIAIPDSLK